MGGDTEPMRRGARWLVHLGTVAAVLGLAKFHATYIGHYDFSGSSRFAWTLVYIGLLSVAAYGVGLPDLVQGRGARVAALMAPISAAVAISFVQLAVGSLLLPRFVVAGAAVLLAPWYTGCAAAAAGGRARGEHRDRVVAVVDPAEAATLRRELAAQPERPATLARALTVAEAEGRDGEVLLAAAAEHRATVLVLDRAAQASDSLVARAAALHESGVRVRTLSLFYDEWLGKLPVSELERVALMFDIGELHRARYGRLKRLGDIGISVAGLVVLVLLVVPVWVINLIGNRGPLFYRQPRVGKRGRPFAMMKFRTMRPGAERTWTSDSDPRVTRFGRVLRRSHLDELPQVVNVLRGDLSVVGPRPEQPQYVAELSERIPFYELRHLVRPGLTGWAQVKYDYGASESDSLEKLQYEFFYLRHQSLTMDLRIIARTIRSVIRGEGR